MSYLYSPVLVTHTWAIKLANSSWPDFGCYRHWSNCLLLWILCPNLSSWFPEGGEVCHCSVYIPVWVILNCINRQIDMDYIAFARLFPTTWKACLWPWSCRASYASMESILWREWRKVQVYPFLTSGALHRHKALPHPWTSRLLLAPVFSKLHS